MDTNQILAVVQSHKDGEIIQESNKGAWVPQWWDNPNPDWDFKTKVYRVKPAPLKESEVAFDTDGRPTFVVRGTLLPQDRAYYEKRGITFVKMREVRED